MPFRFTPLEIPGLVLIETNASEDARGLFMETYRQSEFMVNGVTAEFVQEGYSRSVKGVLRGLHYQKPPRAQSKAVMVVRGEVFDVAVDIRRGSPTYGRWVGLHLSAASPRLLYIPAGFAHGFCVLSQEADLLYRMTEEYVAELDRGILWNDPDLAIRWPVAKPILSGRDADLPTLKNTERDFVYQRVT